METGGDFENISLLVGWENIVASSVTLPQHKCFEGKTIAQIAAMEQKTRLTARLTCWQTSTAR